MVKFLSQVEISRLTGKSRSSINQIIKRNSIPKKNSKIDYQQYSHFFDKIPRQIGNIVKSDNRLLGEIQRDLLLAQERKIKHEADLKEVQTKLRKLELEAEKKNLIPKEEVFMLIDTFSLEVKNYFLKELPKKIVKITNRELTDLEVKNKVKKEVKTFFDNAIEKIKQKK